MLSKIDKTVLGLAFNDIKVSTVQCSLRAPKSKQGTCECQHRVNIFTLQSNIDLLVISSERKPWIGIDWAETCVWASIPLHRCSHGITSIARLTLALWIMSKVGWDRNILHTNFIAIIPGRSSPQCQKEHSGNPGSFTPNTASNTRLIVVAQNPIRPSFRRQCSFVGFYCLPYRLSVPC